MNKNSSLSDYTSNVKCGIGFFVLLPPEHQLINKETETDKFYNILKENQINCNFTVYYMLKDEDYNKIKALNEVEDWYNFYRTGVYISMTKNYEIQTKRWE